MTQIKNMAYWKAKNTLPGSSPMRQEKSRSMKSDFTKVTKGPTIFGKTIPEIKEGAKKAYKYVKENPTIGHVAKDIYGKYKNK